jgi:hypothetical protein
LLTMNLAGLNNQTAPYGGQSKNKGNNMRINECCLKESNARIKAQQNIAESREGFVGALIVLIIFALVSNMSYFDCMNLGVC